MFERFGKKFPGDSLQAEHVNLLTALAEKMGMSVIPANGGYTFDGRINPHPPFRQQLFIIVSSEDDTDDVDDESSYSSSSSSSGESSGGVLGDIYKIRPRYYDHSDGSWKTNEDVGPYDLDSRDLAIQFEVGDTLIAYWDPQRVMWIPIRSGDSTCDERNEVWIFVLLGGTQTGSFDLTFIAGQAQDTVTIQADATAAEFKTQLAAHSQIAETDLDVTGGPFPAVSIAVEFIGELAGQAPSPPSIDQTSLSGGSGLVIKRWQPGFSL